MSVVAMDAQHDAEQRRAEALRELMARPDAEPDPVTAVVQRPAQTSMITALRRSVAGWLTLVRRRPSQTAPNR